MKTADLHRKKPRDDISRRRARENDHHDQLIVGFREATDVQTPRLGRPGAKRVFASVLIALVGEAAQAVSRDQRSSSSSKDPICCVFAYGFGFVVPAWSAAVDFLACFFFFADRLESVLVIGESGAATSCLPSSFSLPFLRPHSYRSYWGAIAFDSQPQWRTTSASPRTTLSLTESMPCF